MKVIILYIMKEDAIRDDKTDMLNNYVRLS
jgi:hypothetical protein